MWYTRTTIPFPNMKAKNGALTGSQGISYTVGHPKKTLTKSFFNPFPHNVACMTSV